MKTVVKQILLSGEPINPSPNSLFLPVPQWTQSATLGVAKNSEGIISEDSTNAIHIVVQNGITGNTFFALQNNVPYRWTVWVRPLGRRFCYLTIASIAGTSGRRSTLWGLDGQGLLDTRSTGSNTILDFTSYKKVRSDIYKLVFGFTLTSGASNQIPVIGLSNSATPTYDANLDVPFQGLNQPSIQVLANECVPV